MKTWKLFIPIFGRYLYFKSTEGKTPTNKRIYTLLENTLAYFLVGVLGAIAIPIPYDFFMVVVTGYLFIIPIEYAIIKLKPHWFLWEGKVSLFPFLWVMYHCFWSLITGYGLGLVIT